MATRHQARESIIGLLYAEDIGNAGIDKFVDELFEADIIVDCIFGTGLNKPLDEKSINLLNTLNSYNSFKIACDIPSGINNLGQIQNVAFEADITITMGALKTSLFSDVAKDYIGEIIVADLGVQRQIYEIDSNKFSSAGSNKLNNCALQFGFHSYNALTTNLKCIRDLRNICAHHSRLWNRNLAAPNAVNKNLKFKPPENQNNRLYSHLVMLRIMCKKRGIDDGIKNFFVNLLSSHQIFQEQHQSMGFPESWEQDPFWD